MSERNKICFISLVLSAFISLAAAQDSSTPEALIKSIYAAHRPWDKKRVEINLFDEKDMSKYFDSEFVGLFQRDLACQKKIEGICGFDVDPVFHSQDSITDAGYDISLRPIKQTDSYAEYEVLVHWVGFEKPNRYIHVINKMPNGWRVSDIQSAGFSIKNSMTKILKENGF
jgi:hypothetical protein